MKTSSHWWTLRRRDVGQVVFTCLLIIISYSDTFIYIMEMFLLITTTISNQDFSIDLTCTLQITGFHYLMPLI